MTLVLGDWLITTAADEPRRGWGVLVAGDRVVEVGPADEMRSQYPGEEIVDASGHVVLPGFVDSHTHLYGVLAHGIPLDDAPAGFWGFLADHWWPRVEDRVDRDMIAAAADWGCAEMLRSGTTTFFDILEAPHALPGALAVEKGIVDRRGIRGILSVEATERAGPEIARLALEENAAAIRWPDDALVTGAMSWHTSFTCSASYVREALALAAGEDALSHAHCNEGAHEATWCEANHGMRTMEWYDSIGAAGPWFLASQCVDLSAREREIVAGRGVRVSHMPLSNCEVGAGIAPISELLDAGVTIGLGSDGYVTDMYEVMRSAFLLPKARCQDPGAMPAPTVLAMATEGGARALGLDRVGRLEPGWQADLQVVDVAFPTPVTADNLADQLVLWRTGSHVRDVMVAGEWRVRDGEVLGADVDEMRGRVAEHAERLWHG